MAGLWQTLKGWFTQKQARTISLTDGESCELVKEIYIRELAFWACVNLVANAVSKCEFKTHAQGKEIHEDVYYRLNTEPNKNQNASEFWKEIVARLYRSNECLVIQHPVYDYFLIADSYTVVPNTLFGDSYQNVQAGEISFQRTFLQKDVFFFALSHQNMDVIISGLYQSYQKLISSSMGDFQAERIKRAVYDMGTTTVPMETEEDVEKFRKTNMARFKDFFNPSNGTHSVFPARNGEDIREYSAKGQYAKGNSRDIRAMIDDVTDFTARAFGIPTALVSGDVQDTSKATEQLLTFCVGPLVSMIEQEINRKLYGRQGLSGGHYIKVYMGGIQYVDVLSVATSIDKLIASGAFCINDIRKLCGQPIIDEPWAWVHMITKNYTTLNTTLKGIGDEAYEDGIHDG